MDLEIAGKTALVTGSTAGIGFATAEALAREGATVIVNGRTDTRVQEAVEKIKAAVAGAQVTRFAADLATEKGVADLVAAHPAVDILVNNLGIFEPKSFEETSDADWLRIFETNVLSGVRLSRHYLPKMKAVGWGRIVFVSSESALQIPVESILYGMTKTAQLAVARGLAETTTGTNVTVNSVLPGPTLSEGLAGFMKKMAQNETSEADAEKEFFKTARPTSILKRFITPNEVANLIVYLCSGKASATNGAALSVDGGVVRAIA